jgi:nucleolar complex protein 3
MTMVCLQQVLEVFLHLRLQSVHQATGEDKGQPQAKKAKKNSVKLSRQERKHRKALEKVEQQMKETQAEESQTKKTKLQTSVLDQVFLTYFRILKQAPDSQLLSPALKGLAKFAHLINVDFFADLMSVLSSLLASGVGVV